VIETKLEGKTPDIGEENIKKLKAIFPEVFTEGKVDFEKLKQLLGDHVEDSNERYNFTWNGKGRALRLSQTPSLGTLRPCKEESKNWDTTENLYIEGDNLEVLKLLQKSYYGKVKMIYIDPPYNTGKDFVYKDDFHDSLENYKRITGQVDGNGNRLSTNTETSGRYHTDWLNMMYPRLRLARNLLTDDGVIFISIDDNEVYNLRKLCDETFGEDNFIGQIAVETANGVFGTRASGLSSTLVKVKDYVISYARSSAKKNFCPLYMPTNERFDTHYSIMIDENLERSSLIEYIKKSDNMKYYFERYKLNISLNNITKLMHIDNEFNEIMLQDLSSHIYQDVAFSLNIPPEIEEKLKSGEIVNWKNYLIFRTNKGKGTLRHLIPFKSSLRYTDDYISEYRCAVAIGDLWEGFDNDMKNVSKEGVGYFDTPKPVRLIKQLIKWCNIGLNDIVLDFFSGSATTAHAVMQLNAEDGGNRKFIMVQLPEPTDEKSEAYKAGYINISEIGKERIRRAGEKIKEENKDKEGIEDLDIGFKVLKLDTSNIRKWQPDYDNLEQSLLDYVDNFVEGRTELDVVYEIMLKYGLDLTYPVDEFTIARKKVYSIGFGMLMICLDNEITTEVAKGIIAKVKELNPEKGARVVFKDNGFKTDSNKTNIKEILKAANIEEFITL
jgi:adenine-specific DNA-methyltransferase